MKPRPVLIEWTDSCDWHVATWMDLDILDEGVATGCDVVSVGWLVQKSKQSVVLAMSITEADDGRGLFVIPTSCVKRIVRLSP